MTPKKTLLTLKIEMPVMTTTKAYEKALEIAKQIKEDEGVRVRGITVVS